MKKINLHGCWQLRLDSDQTGLERRYYESSHDYPEHIHLPSTVSEGGFGSPSPAITTDHLTDPYAFEGFAWYRKTVSMPDDYRDYIWELYLERTRMTQVYINGMEAGKFDSLCTPHCYDITPWLQPGENRIVILVKNTGYPTKGGHMTSPDTQTNWNGLLGALELRPLHIQHIKSLQFYPSFSGQRLTIQGQTSLPDGTLEFLIQDSHENIVIRKTCDVNNNEFQCLIPLQNKLLPWNEYDPALYTLCVTLYSNGMLADEQTHPFGIRDFKAGKHHFLVNGIPVFLRGKHDGMIFPLTGYAPMEVGEWLKVMGTAKEYGINHYRFHTCCPPEAAFLAADLLGIYLEPELPFWGTITEPDDEGHDETMQQYLISEGYRILDTYGNHPSFVMFSLGNELWGSKKMLSRILKGYQAYDKRHLYVQGSNNFQFSPCILPEDDFFSGVRFSKNRLFRGSYAMCDAPLGHIQTYKPGTDYSYDSAILPPLFPTESPGVNDSTRQIQYGTGIKEVSLIEEEALIPDIPVISHEIGQYESFPDFSEINKYSGVLKAGNLLIFKKRLEKAGLGTFASNYFYSSGKLAAACYKEELETALRSSHLAGFQLLDLQDFSGQGTALVGVLNAFMENKGIISRECWNQFCAPVVLLASFSDYVASGGCQLPCKLLVSNYSPCPLHDVTITLQLVKDSECSPSTPLIYNEQSFSLADIPRGLSEPAELALQMPDTDTPCHLLLKLSMDSKLNGNLFQKINNEYSFWIYPETTPVITEDLYIAHDKNALQNILERIDAAEHSNKKVLFFPSHQANAHSIEGTYCTDFWCYPMFRSISENMGKPVPPGTLGLLIQNAHPALSHFPCNCYSTPQWWDIVMNSRSTILDKTNIIPIVQTIDNVERNHRLGLIYEVKCNNCHILVCTADLTTLTDSLPGKWLLESLGTYLAKDMKQEIYSLSEKEFLSLFT